jgi:hypothetical protein
MALVPVDNESTFQLKEYNWHRMGYLCNLFGSQGAPGNVLEVRVKRRKGSKNFITCMREGLQEKFPGKLIGLGGTFKMLSGRFKAHIMPQFLSRYMEDSPNDSGKWLKFFEFGSGATFLTTLVSGNPPPELHVRVEHTHFFNKSSGTGGHYHYDTTPEDVEYLAYLNTAEFLYRIEDAFDRSKSKLNSPAQ